MDELEREIRKRDAAVCRMSLAEARAERLADVVRRGIDAMRLTREYVGEAMLPEIEGWSWYDWMLLAREELARG